MILPPVAPTSGASPYGAGWPQPGQLEPVTGFGSGGWKPPATFVPTAAPVAWLFGAVGAGAVALAAGLLAMYLKLPWLAIAAWAIGGPATIALTTVFTSVDTSRRTQIGYGQGRDVLARLLYWGSLALGLAGVVVAAVYLAFWAGRGF